MKRRLLISNDAETDLLLIWVYHAEKSERSATRIRKEIVSKYNLLLQFPMAGRNREELQTGLRSLPIENDVIFYRVTDDFPFTDLSSTKRRPAVVLWADPAQTDFTLAFISSQNVTAVSAGDTDGRIRGSHRSLCFGIRTDGGGKRARR